MISDYSIVESGASEQRCQVVHWLRTFPFSFISQREYVIGRRVWHQDGALYGIMKSIKHPQAPPVSGIVRMDVFYSMWRSRTIPDPKDPSRPACETVLLHHEQFKIPENLSRFAVRHGMAGFVKKMAPAVKAFVAARRERVDPVKHNPLPGMGFFLSVSEYTGTVSAVAGLKTADWRMLLQILHPVHFQPFLGFPFVPGAPLLCIIMLHAFLRYSFGI